MIKWLMHLLLLVNFLCAVFLFRTKQAVMDLEKSIYLLTKKIEKTKNENLSLENKLSQLTTPQRIQRLVKKHMPHLRPLSQAQRIDVSSKILP